MRRECIQAVSKALGRDLNGSEVQDIEQRIVRAARAQAQADPAAWLAKSQAERLTEAGQRAAAELLHEAHVKAEREALQLAANTRVAQKLNEAHVRGLDGLQALDRMIAFHADGRLDGISVESTAKAIRNDLMRQLIPVMEASNPKWFGLLENQEGIEDITRALFGEKTQTPEAAAGAKVWKEVTTAARKRFNAAGGDIGTLDDWGMPHHHSQPRVAKAGRDAWVAEILPKLNRNKYFREDGARMTDAELTEFLKEAWRTIATGGANKLEPGQFRGNGMRANRGNASRQIHFKDAQSYIDYQQKFGERSLYEVLTGHIEGIAKDIALVETFGPNPDHAFRYFRDQAVQEAKTSNPIKSGDVDKRAIRTENLYNVVAGRTQPVANERLANGFDTVRNWLTASRLGGAVISSLSDEATLHLTARLNNLPQMRLLANQLSTLNPANKMEERMAMRAGLALNTFISSLNRFGQDNLASSFSKRLAGTVLRASGLNAITEARRRAFGVTMMGSLGGVAKDHASLGKIDPKDAALLKRKGVTDDDFKLWKASKLEDWGGGNDTMLTPDSIYRLTDAEIDAAIPRIGNLKTEAAKARNRTAAREQAATRLLSMVLEETDMAVIEPGAKERAFMGAGIQRGTWKGELMRSFFLFKSFPLAMIMRHWARGMNQPTGTGRAAYIATLMASTTVLGAMAMQVKELIAGRDPRNLNPFAEHGMKNWMKAMLQGGSLGLYGDFLFSESTQRGQSPIASFLGPVVGLAEDAFKLTQGNLIQAAKGEETDFGAEAMRMVQGNLPGGNLWYTKAAMDHLIWNQLAEYFSPGYLGRMRRRQQKEFGARYWWEPGEIAPDRAPDLSAVAGE